jgi:hypothetical protein
MKSLVFISLITIFLCKILQQEDEKEKQHFRDIIKMIEQAHQNKTGKIPEFITDEVKDFKEIKFDTSSTILIDDAFIERFGLPKALKSVFQEIYIDKDSDEVYQKIEGLKKRINEHEVTAYYLIHSQYIYNKNDDKKKIICSVFSTFKFKLPIKYDTIEKTICNKGFMIESCKNVKILQFHSYMNDKELNEIGEYIAYKSEEKFKHYLEELYPVKG